MKAFFLLLPALTLSIAARCQQPKTYFVESRESRIDRTGSTLVYKFEVLEKLPDGKLRIRATQLDIRPNGTGAPQNAAAWTENPVNNTSLALNLVLMQAPIELILDPRNPVRQPGFEQLIMQRAKEMGISDNYANMMAQNSISYFWKELSAIFLPIPANEMKWYSKDSAMLYTVSGQAGGKRTVTGVNTKVQTDPNTKVRISNSYQWDDAAGGLTTATLQTQADGVYDNNGESTKYHHEDTTTLRMLREADISGIEQVPPDLIEMLIKTSHWSKALWDKAGVSYDSAKAMAFFQKMDPLFGHYKGYVQKKLGILQLLNVKNSYKLYDAALKKTPNYALEGSSIHLHNKLQDVWDNQPDSAMQLIPMLAAADRRSFESWMQHSFAQGIFNGANAEMMAEIQQEMKKEGLSDEEIAKHVREARQRSENTMALSQKLIESGNPAVADAARPMYIARQAQRTQNPDSLRLFARQLAALTPKQWRAGNAGRYELMLYKTFLDRKMDKDAASLLGNTIATLEKGTADSLNKARFADQNLLAYAYYLQYEAGKRNNAKDAMNYYAKAAAVSPRDSKERAHDSFYDRALLNSKESYREGFANALFKEGDRQEGMKVLAQQVNANPAMLSEVRKAFEKHMPGRDFKDFVDNALVRTWKMAPDFELTGPDGKKHKLSDYRGKWLLIDFWGTWCGPCRNELPEIEKLNRSLKPEGNSAFLSIACRDTPEQVTNFMAAEKYTFPVAMSNGRVEREYPITGYPSKFIISPDGRMLQVAFNLDWQGAFEHFSQLKSNPVKTGEQNNVNKQLN